MDVQGIGSTPSSGQVQKKDNATLDKNSFMKLFVAQMQNQDPLKPMDGQDLAAQLAQFSSLEQLYSLNNGIDKLAAYQASQNNLQALSLMGKVVEADGNSVTLQGGKPTQALYQLDGNAASRIINIKNQNGDYVRTLKLGNADSGRYALDWDGLGQGRQPLSDGQYTFEVLATDGQGAQVPASTLISGSVAAVHFDKGVANLILSSGQQIGVSDISKIIYTNQAGSQEQTKS